MVPALGGASGTATGYAITSHESSAATASRTMEIRMDAKQVKKDDQFLVGSLVGALLVPAIFREFYYEEISLVLISIA